MKTSKKFDDVLDECLERLLVRGETIEQCLQSYPEQATELKPLLQTVLEVKQASTIQPNAEFRARAKYQFNSLLQEVISKRGRSFLSWVPRWATVVAIVLGLVLAGSGTVAAANYSMPDEPLYPVKLTVEQVQMRLTFSELGRAKLSDRLVARRVTEIIYMASKGNARQVRDVTKRMDEGLAKLALAEKGRDGDEMLTLPPVPEPSEEAEAMDGGHKGLSARAVNRAKVRAIFARSAAIQKARLEAALKNKDMPEPARLALYRACDSVADYQKDLEALD